MNRIFFRSTVVNTWELINFEDIKDGDKIKMVEMSPDQTEVLYEIWDVVKGYSPKTGVFEGDLLNPAIYLPATKEMKELFKNARTHAVH